jgi:hypothetical protein
MGRTKRSVEAHDELSNLVDWLRGSNRSELVASPFPLLQDCECHPRNNLSGEVLHEGGAER